MNNSYSDIRDLIGRDPIWFDEQAVPRYCDFTPRETANIYANECCLLLIECQDCGTEFRVCISRGSWQTLASSRSLASFVKDDELHYGDPPNACPATCVAGSTMNSVPIRVLEFWRSEMPTHTWERVPELEVEIAPDWISQ